MKKNSNKNKEIVDNLVNIVSMSIDMLTFANKFSLNREYMENIGTIYKGSIKESNRLLRFKERFKMKYILAYNYAQGNMGR